MSISLNDELRIEKLEKLESILIEHYDVLSYELKEKLTKLNDEYYDI